MQRTFNRPPLLTGNDVEVITSDEAYYAAGETRRKFQHTLSEGTVWERLA